MVEYIKVGGADRFRRKTKNQTETSVKVINKGYSSRTAIRLAVSIMRPTKWGNPYPMLKEKNRDRVCEQYNSYIATRLIKGEITDDDFHEFDGKNLLCVCKPKRCHGDTLVMLYYMTHEQRLDWANDKLSLVHGKLE